MRLILGSCLLVAACSTAVTPVRTGPNPTPAPVTAAILDPGLELVLDARDLPRGLMRSRVDLDLPAGPQALLFPRWIPGTHAPGNPVENLVDLHIRSGDRELPWRRDEADAWRFQVTVPAEGQHLSLTMTYIANNGRDASSEAADVSVGDHLALINANACLLYPEGRPISRLMVGTRLLLPKGWQAYGALAQERREGDSIRFARTSLRELVDRPLLLGDQVVSERLSCQGPPAFLHAGSTAGGKVHTAWAEGLGRVVDQGQKLFGHAHYRDYHFLLMAGFGHLGLEHRATSANGIGNEALADFSQAQNWERTVAPHEFVHAWIGTSVRPQGMLREDYQTPQQTALLWVYEGMTTYYGQVLSARGGMIDAEDFRQRMVEMVDRLMTNGGRAWQSIEDTAIAGWLLRTPSRRWAGIRRTQDYYTEGAWFWLEADLRIRIASNGKRSLDDVCKALFGAPIAPEANGGSGIRTYTLDDVVATLNAVQPDDWRRRIEQRMLAVSPEVPTDWFDTSGWRLVMAAKPEGMAKMMEQGEYLVGARHSLGCDLAKGWIRSLVPGSPADRAGLHEGMRVVAVEGKPATAENLRAALAAAKQGGRITLRIWTTQGVDERAVVCTTGPRYLTAERIPDTPDRLAGIIASQ